MKQLTLTCITVLSALIFCSCGAWWDATTSYDYYVDPMAPPPPPVYPIGNVPVYYPNYNYAPTPPPPSYNPGFNPGFKPAPSQPNRPSQAPNPPQNNNGGLMGNPGNNNSNSGGQRPGANGNSNGGTYNGKRPGTR
ncbi:MAG: hypothetical protein K2M07_06495 [Muribaculaceae bacterium]|nr:hypothetical protein [Muribaculaceae bacterium]